MAVEDVNDFIARVHQEGPAHGVKVPLNESKDVQWSAPASVDAGDAATRFGLAPEGLTNKAASLRNAIMATADDDLYEKVAVAALAGRAAAPIIRGAKALWQSGVPKKVGKGAMGVLGSKPVDATMTAAAVNSGVKRMGTSRIGFGGVK